MKIDKKALGIVRSGLRGAVADKTGTSHMLFMDKLTISGKTGTAQVSGAKSHGWFTGYIEEPNWAVCVFLENCGGSFVACNVFKDILLEVIQQNILDRYNDK